ncbi:sn-glycerol-1-phosphate dehydrogenase [Microvirga puerhi]|uniref:Sn-glycerol-1-phosphate dehydrogenase n=1 Tax=Microvirga puerhi TaxID=2876078 RepID=A0ABS7VQQ5_9HYPH|nr:sn-glycerol-1-phosphate dehydrogenase [Microvirga puerhi]MBZ6077882.1 sn-glycerol-1-phosphate dehydrogenase [Microvirga puerhi]
MADQARALNRAVQKAAVTRSVFVAPGALGALPESVKDFEGKQLVVIADDNTMEAAGRQAITVLEGAGHRVAAPIVLEDKPRAKPHARTAREIAAAIRDSGAVPISVGSGVINDLTKYAAEVAGVPYVCVATAASMDGYAASGAALLDDGFKRTLDCAPPVSVVADLDIVAKAPRRMAGWGYGDLAGKIVAGLDWKLADALGEEAINPEPFAMVQDNVREWLSQPKMVGAGDAAATGDLVNGLLVSGFAMQAHGNSRPASGAEHLISHVWEMERLTFQGEPAAHGACVGIGTVGLLALYEWLLAQDITEDTIRNAEGAASSPERIEAEIAAGFPEGHLADSARTEMAVKGKGASRRAGRLSVLARTWRDLRNELQRTCVPAETMETWLREAGAPAHPNDLGMPLKKLAADYRRARLIRRRYTILDLLDDLGWLDKGIAALFAADGFWGRRSAAEMQKMASA